MVACDPSVPPASASSTNPTFGSNGNRFCSGIAFAASFEIIIETGPLGTVPELLTFERVFSRSAHLYADRPPTSSIVAPSS